MNSASPDIDKALQAIASHNSEPQRNKRKEENKKQANILLYEATLYEQKGAWSEAKRRYEEALDFDDSYENNFNYAYFLQSKTPDDRRADKYYLIAVAKCHTQSQKATTLNNLAVFYADDNTKRQEAEEKYKEALDIYRDLAKTNEAVYARDYANTLVMGVYLFGDDKVHLVEALEMLAPYDDSYANVGFLRQIIRQLQE